MIYGLKQTLRTTFVKWHLNRFTFSFLFEQLDVSPRWLVNLIESKWCWRNIFFSCRCDTLLRREEEEEGGGRREGRGGYNHSNISNCAKWSKCATWTNKQFNRIASASFLNPADVNKMLWATRFRSILDRWSYCTFNISYDKHTLISDGHQLPNSQFSILFYQWNHIFSHQLSINGERRIA